MARTGAPEYDGKCDPMINIARGLFAIAQSLDAVAYQLQYLGNGNASTQMGAIENLAKEVKEGLSELTSSVRDSLYQAPQYISPPR